MRPAPSALPLPASSKRALANAVDTRRALRAAAAAPASQRSAWARQLIQLVEGLEEELSRAPQNAMARILAEEALGALAMAACAEGRAFLRARLGEPHGQVACAYGVLEETGGRDFDSLAAGFRPAGGLAPDPLLEAVMQVLLHGRHGVFLPGLGGGPKTRIPEHRPRDAAAVDWARAHPGWLEVALDLARLLGAPPAPEWKLLPFAGVELLGVIGGPDAEEATLRLVGRVSVVDLAPALRRFEHRKAELASRLLGERERLLGDPDEAERDEEGGESTLEVLDDLLRKLGQRPASCRRR